MNEHSHLYNLVNGAIGAVGSFLGVLSTCQEQLEFSVRITGGLIGILVWQTFGDWLTQDGQMEKAASAYQTSELKKRGNRRKK